MIGRFIVQMRWVDWMKRSCQGKSNTDMKQLKTSNKINMIMRIKLKKKRFQLSV